MTHCKLNIDIRAYWHPGTGRGTGAVLDAITHRDSLGLPVLPGRHLKGLLRDALENASAFGWDGYADLAERFFGDRPETAENKPSPGSLRVSDATLPVDVARWLAASSDGKKLIPALYRSVFATAIELKTGTARDKSLRGIEVVVPLMLGATIEPIPGAETPDGWPEKLRAVLPLIDAVGAHRNRGLGRAVLSLEVAA